MLHSSLRTAQCFDRAVAMSNFLRNSKSCLYSRDSSGSDRAVATTVCKLAAKAADVKVLAFAARVCMLDMQGCSIC